jgi:hypothetical protein
MFDQRKQKTSAVYAISGESMSDEEWSKSVMSPPLRLSGPFGRGIGNIGPGLSSRSRCALSVLFGGTRARRGPRNKDYWLSELAADIARRAAEESAEDAGTLPPLTPEIAVLRGHDGFVYSAAFSPDGSRIVTASADKIARIWDARIN